MENIDLAEKISNKVLLSEVSDLRKNYYSFYDNESGSNIYKKI